MSETAKQIFDKDSKDYLPVFNRYKIVVDHGEGVYTYDNEGNKYIDFLAGIAVNVLGHNYKPLVNAVAEQAAKVISYFQPLLYPATSGRCLKTC